MMEYGMISMAQPERSSSKFANIRNNGKNSGTVEIIIQEFDS